MFFSYLSVDVSEARFASDLSKLSFLHCIPTSQICCLQTHFTTWNASECICSCKFTVLPRLTI